MKNNVKKLRLENRMKQEDIDIYELCLLADYFGVSTDFILGRTSIRSTPESSNIYEKLIIDKAPLLQMHGK